MRKQLLALSLVLVMLMGIAAQATGPIKAPNASPTLSFSGTTATCTRKQINRQRRSNG